MSTESTGTALVIEGGGLRGAFVAGALRHLVDAEIQFENVFATSAGAASAAYAIAGQIDQALKIWQERTHGGQLISFRHLMRGRSLMDIEGMVNAFRCEYPLDAAALGTARTQLFVAVTDCNLGRAAYLRATETNLFELLRATMALPIVYGRVVGVEGRPCIDGGITDAIPFAPALEQNPERVIVVSTRPIGFRKKPVRFGKDWLRHGYREYPEVAHALRQRCDVYNQNIEKLEALERMGRVVVIRPEQTLPASRLTRDRGRIVETLELGQAAAAQAMSRA